jgi:hypothetical protein
MDVEDAEDHGKKERDDQVRPELMAHSPLQVHVLLSSHLWTARSGTQSSFCARSAKRWPLKGEKCLAYSSLPGARVGS